MESNSIEPRTVAEISNRYPAFSVGALRWALFSMNAPPGTRAHEVYGGLKPAVIRLGRRVLIDERGFRAWLASRRQP